jgi:hypothetical protein
MNNQFETVKWTDVMVDLETLGTGPDARVLSVGAVCFDRVLGALGPRFYVEVRDAGGAIDVETVRWWSKRESEGFVMPGAEEFVEPVEAVGRLAKFLKEHWDEKEGRMWSWGIDFDLVILRGLIERSGVAVRWQHWNQRCARTFCAEAGVRREGKVMHHALEDAVQEAWAVVRCGVRRKQDPTDGTDPTDFEDAETLWGFVEQEPDVERGWGVYRECLAETRGWLLPTWEGLDGEVKEAFAAAVWEAWEMGGGTDPADPADLTDLVDGNSNKAIL